MSFQTRNNLYRFIHTSDFNSPAARFPFDSAQVVADWLMWIKENDAANLTDEEQRLLSCLILAARLDFKSAKK